MSLCVFVDYFLRKINICDLETAVTQKRLSQNTTAAVNWKLVSCWMLASRQHVAVEHDRRSATSREYNVNNNIYYRWLFLLYTESFSRLCFILESDTTTKFGLLRKSPEISELKTTDVTVVLVGTCIIIIYHICIKKQ